ncbi:MAG: glutathione S-transferase family protein [Rhodospirillaceae bacterium]|nr:glutathione S-transferase family protein [Rhodospirillaceae bacterium]
MLKIHGRNNSSNVQKVLWTCAEMALPFERIDVGGAFGGNREPAYLALNPNGLVPVIEDDGVVLWESNTIIRYLAARYGDGSLLPGDPAGRGRVEQWMDWSATTLGPAMAPLFFGLIRTPPDQRDHAAMDKSRTQTAATLAILDAELARRPFVAGDHLTLADMPAGIIAYRWYAFDIEHPDLPNLAAWYARLTERPAFRQHVMIGVT